MSARGAKDPGDSQRTRRVQAQCEEAGVPLTRPRQIILDVVLGLRTHPTAEEVFAEAARREPGIGRATVYRALEGFARAGVITKVPHPGPRIRYDGTIDQHHHMVCLRCDRIVDFADRSLDRVRAPEMLKYDFVVSDVQVVLRGVCHACLSEG